MSILLSAHTHYQDSVSLISTFIYSIGGLFCAYLFYRTIIIELKEYKDGKKRLTKLKKINGKLHLKDENVIIKKNQPFIHDENRIKSNKEILDNYEDYEIALELCKKELLKQRYIKNYSSLQEYSFFFDFNLFKQYEAYSVDSCFTISNNTNLYFLGFEKHNDNILPHPIISVHHKKEIGHTVLVHEKLLSKLLHFLFDKETKYINNYKIVQVSPPANSFVLKRVLNIVKTTPNLNVEIRENIIVIQSFETSPKQINKLITLTNDLNKVLN